MRHWPVALITAALVAAAPAEAGVSKPHFARSYRGTLSGSFTSKDSSRTVKESWKVTGVVFRLYKTRAFEGGWTGMYKVTAGTVDFTASQVGPCTWNVHDSFGIVKSLPRPNPSVPLALDKNPLGSLHMLGLMDPERTLKTTETCPDPNGGEPFTDEQDVEVPTVFDPGEKNWKPGRRLKASHVVRDPYSDPKTTQIWSWDLKPR